MQAKSLCIYEAQAASMVKAIDALRNAVDKDDDLLVVTGVAGSNKLLLEIQNADYVTQASATIPAIVNLPTMQVLDAKYARDAFGVFDPDVYITVAIEGGTSCWSSPYWGKTVAIPSGGIRPEQMNEAGTITAAMDRVQKLTADGSDTLCLVMPRQHLGNEVDRAALCAKAGIEYPVWPLNEGAAVAPD